MNIKTISIVILALFSSLLSAAELIDLSVPQLQAMRQNSEALIIDIRTEKEWQATGTLPASHKLQFFNASGDYDAEKWLAELKKLKSSPDQPVVLVCRSGNRSGMVGNFLAKQLGMKNVYHLSSGIESWLQAGQEVDAPCPNKVACK
ncbi:rhodanese-like domain-containing protein [Methylomarinum sp. Ch1-1]|uniref:Rhodanese-like domain-containing protein n=1 Tax=Methylomarinum roseum TaxID=3067653 RepID=A0AAU7NTS2_9GAMM|nr:rhodanese-like domain-containing protein [Methylomarinum sp. Ch1-1]MDP4519583.1 rhodanese-like domain-containing protein [Methylomarinum sp. Ch1-1]